MEELILRGIASPIAPGSAASSTKIPFTYTGQRYGVLIQAYASPVYVKAVTAGGADPVPSSTDYYWQIPVGDTLFVKAGNGLDFYVISSGNYSAQVAL